MINEEFIKRIIQQVNENESLLKNIPSSNFRLLLEAIQKILIYVDYKHLNPKRKEKAIRKKSGVH